jgi:hypothetical protein
MSNVPEHLESLSLYDAAFRRILKNFRQRFAVIWLKQRWKLSNAPKTLIQGKQTIDVVSGITCFE